VNLLADATREKNETAFRMGNFNSRCDWNVTNAAVDDVTRL